MEIKDKVPPYCCVCGHKLSNHFKEKGGWRCHEIARDFYQCECWLREQRGIVTVTLDNYDARKRAKECLKEMVG